ncbi:MAG TPA: hypothetical protein DC049_05025 [Spirochaetia bacterium]|nr:hypothetical protein [Spirochaetia bacterium]
MPVIIPFYRNSGLSAIQIFTIQAVFFLPVSIPEVVSYIVCAIKLLTNKDACYYNKGCALKENVLPGK